MLTRDSHLQAQKSLSRLFAHPPSSRSFQLSQIDRSALTAIKLSSKGARNSQARVRIGEEFGRVCLNLLDPKSLASVFPICDDAGHKRTLEATDAASALLVTHRIGESNSRCNQSSQSLHILQSI
jgi:hypothetical protein